MTKFKRLGVALLIVVGTIAAFFAIVGFLEVLTLLFRWAGAQQWRQILLAGGLFGSVLGALYLLPGERRR